MKEISAFVSRHCQRLLKWLVLLLCHLVQIFRYSFTTLLDSDMRGGLITGEPPDELFESESSVGSAIEVWGKFDVVEGGRTAILGLSVVYEIASVESSAYCSSSTAQLQACACQCDDNNNCVDGLIQTPSSRSEFCQLRLSRLVFVLSCQLIVISLLPLRRRC